MNSFTPLQLTDLGLLRSELDEWISSLSPEAFQKLIQEIISISPSIIGKPNRRSPYYDKRHGAWASAKLTPLLSDEIRGLVIDQSQDGYGIETIRQKLNAGLAWMADNVGEPWESLEANVIIGRKGPKINIVKQARATVSAKSDINVTTISANKPEVVEVVAPVTRVRKIEGAQTYPPGAAKQRIADWVESAQSNDELVMNIDPVFSEDDIGWVRSVVTNIPEVSTLILIPQQIHLTYL